MADNPYLALVRPWQAGTAKEWHGHGIVQSPFQTTEWLDCWYRAFASDTVEPIFIEVREQASGASVFALPLICHIVNGRKVISFADLEVTDYNAPLLGARPPQTIDACRQAWNAVSRALPACDLCVFEKMPERIGTLPNPLTQALGGEVSHLFGNLVQTGESLEAWRATLDGHARGEFARLWRVFAKNPDARFIRAHTVAEATPLLFWLEKWQSRRSAELGRSSDDYRLDQPRYAGLYRDFLRRHCDSGQVVLTALACGERIVAVSYAIASGTYYAHVRIAFDPEFSKASPARLLLERSVTALHAEGYRNFDFTIGDYQHKRKFNVRHLPLRNVTLARSLAGLPTSGLAHAKAFVKSHPTLERLARRLMDSGAKATNAAA